MASTMKVLPDRHDMAGLYVALHDFTCEQQHVLAFKKSQIVEITKTSSSTNWHRGRINGKAGFLPANGYLKIIDLASCTRVTARQDFDASTSGQLKIYEGQVLRVVAKNNVQWWTVRSETGRWGQVPAKYLKVLDGSSAAEGNVTVHTPSPDVADRPVPLSRTQSQQFQTEPTRHSISPIPRSSTIHRTGAVSPDFHGKPKDKRRDVVKISNSLVEGVRKHGVKYQTSKEIIQCVLGKLVEEYPEWEEQLNSLCRTLNTEADLESNSIDSLKLEQLFEQLIALTDDEQQRGWSCKDDTAEIDAMLTDIHTILKNANPNVVVQVLQNVKYEPLLTLVQYYQLEKRGMLKRMVLEVLHELMLLRPDPVCSILLTSRLPIQLATDIQSTKVLQQLEWQCKVFSTCLSYNNVMPRSHFDQLDTTFITLLLAHIEAHELPYDPEEQIPMLFLKCLLSLNIHYTDLRHNELCSILKSRSHATVLTEMLLVAFNRGENLTGYFPSNANSVNKLMTDLLNSPDTAELFFTNDVKVLLEVLLRNVLDRGEGDQDRLLYLNLLDLVITNTEYEEHMHLRAEILDLLLQIKEEDDPVCRTLAKKILKSHRRLLS